MPWCKWFIWSLWHNYRYVVEYSPCYNFFLPKIQFLCDSKNKLMYKKIYILKKKNFIFFIFPFLFLTSETVSTPMAFLQCKGREFSQYKYWSLYHLSIVSKFIGYLVLGLMLFSENIKWEDREVFPEKLLNCILKNK